MFSHYTIKVTMLFLIAVVFVNVLNYIFYVYNPNTEALTGARRPIATGVLQIKDFALTNELIKPMQSYHGIRPGKLSNAYVDNDKLCPAIPPGLGPVFMNATLFRLPATEDSHSILKDGLNKMKSCVPRERVAIVVPIPAAAPCPFEFVNYLHSFLRMQMLEYQVIVVKQSAARATSPYHRGKLINAAFKELQVLRKPFNCIIIHDPSVLPVDTRNIYRCSWYPRQLVATLDNDNVTINETCFGGAIALTPDQFLQANGFSNTYENNAIFSDIAKRLMAANYIIERTSPAIGNYISFMKTGTVQSGSEMVQNSSHSSPKDGVTSLSYSVEKNESWETFLYLQINFPNNTRSSMTQSSEVKSVPEAALQQQSDDNFDDINVVNAV